MTICSINTSMIPFCASTDSTRLNMATRQLAQSLTHPNCEVPYVISRNWRDLRDASTRGIKIAKNNGHVVYNNSDLLITYYPLSNNGKGEYSVDRIPPIKRTHANFCSSLRNSLKEGSSFKEGDILFEYDAFNQGFPTFGYNVSTMMAPFFGFNHEDAIVVSESFAEKAKHKYIEQIYVPIYEFTLLQKMYSGDLQYFPEVGDKINKDTLCCSLLPSGYNKKDFDPSSLRTKILSMLRGMNLSDLLNIKVNGSTSGFVLEKTKSKVENGIVTGIKIHRLKKDSDLIDKDLDIIMEKLRTKYGEFLLNTINDLSNKFNENFVKSLAKKYLVYSDADKTRGKSINLRDASYLLEFEITKEQTSDYGDKFANRYAGKGVISLILPDELRPYAVNSKIPIDHITNPFGK